MARFSPLGRLVRDLPEKAAMVIQVALDAEPTLTAAAKRLKTSAQTLRGHCKKLGIEIEGEYVDYDSYIADVIGDLMDAETPKKGSKKAAK